MFLSVDRAWKDLMRRVEDRPNAIKSAITPGTLETLQQNNLTLNIIQKNLEVSIVGYLVTALVDFIVFNATFSNISAISWQPVLVVEKTGENHRPWASNW